MTWTHTTCCCALAFSFFPTDCEQWKPVSRVEFMVSTTGRYQATTALQKIATFFTLELKFLRILVEKIAGNLLKDSVKPYFYSKLLHENCDFLLEIKGKLGKLECFV